MKNKNNPTIIFVVFLFVVFGCSSASDENVSTISPSKPFITAAAVAPSAAPVSNKNLAAKTESKRAVVIAENSSLQQTANQNGNIIQSLPRDTNVEIIRQKGAWFYVRALRQAGWVHGNTIRIVGDNPAADYSTNSTNDSTASMMSRGTSTKTINTTGAIARCADGTLSYSQHRRGTCSHHGGVADWF